MTDKLNQRTSATFLEYLLALYLHQRLLVLCDNASWHKGGTLLDRGRGAWEPPSLRTVRAGLPHTALRSVVHLIGIGQPAHGSLADARSAW